MRMNFALVLLVACLPLGPGSLLRAGSPVRTTQADARSSSTVNPYEQWLAEDVRWIITSGERTRYLRLATDEQRDRFIEQFWLRRDPTPGTTKNEFKQEHYRRLAYANAQFAANTPGWQTDRGKTYIVFGPPTEIRRGVSLISGSSRPTLSWTYRSLPGVGKNVRFEFVDICTCGDYRGRSVHKE